MNDTSFGRGVLCAVISFVVWGILPLYWKTIAAVDPLHILAGRIIFSLALVGAILLIKKDTKWLAVYRDARKARLIICAAVAVSINWGLYIWAINAGHTIEASLGYYMNPLLSIILGLVFFREKLKALQWAAFGLALAGVMILTFLSGSFPWLSLALALSFGLYGLLKKKIQLSALESLAAETAAALPFGVLLLFFRLNQGGGLTGPDPRALSYLGNIPAGTLLLLALSGAATTLPLYFFAWGTKLLPLSTVGFIQFLTPTFNFILGFFVFREYFPARYFAAFACIWLAVIVYVISLRQGRREAPPART